VLGQDVFLETVVRYMTKFPSKTFSLRNLGYKFSEFLRTDRKLPATIRPLVSEIAAVQWAQIESFDSAEAPMLTDGDLTSPDFVNLKLGLQPSLHLFTLKYEADKWVFKAREATRDDASNVRKKKKSSRRVIRASKAPVKKDIFLAVHRVSLRVKLSRVNDVEFALLKSLKRGGTIGQVLRRVLMETPDVPHDKVQKAFQEFSRLGWLAKVPPAGKVAKAQSAKIVRM
jgi:hypothetical protein